tara:strand:+ start:5233 stop:5496 length:264 start_codon:yes stop_codon:yes gene_type:complete
MRIRDQIIKDARITTIKVYYWMPDYESILQLFLWQFDDIPPQFPKAHKFLNHWHNNVEARIKDIYLSYAGHLKQVEFNPIDDIFNIH